MPEMSLGPRYRCADIVSLCLFTMGFLFFLVGFSTTSWLKGPDFEIGLWRQCIAEYGKKCSAVGGEFGVSWRWRMVQVLLCLALGTYLLAVAMSLLHLCVRRAVTIAVASSGLTAAFIILSTIIFIVDSLQDSRLKYLNFSFGLVQVSGVLAIAHASLMNRQDDDDEEDKDSTDPLDAEQGNITDKENTHTIPLNNVKQKPDIPDSETVFLTNSAEKNMEDDDMYDSEDLDEKEARPVIFY